jgi:porphobilinogen deaminase
VGTGVGGTADAAVAAVVAAAIVATSCRDPVASAAPCGGSLATAALSAARDALDERRLVGTDVPDLSTLAGVRSGTVDAALRARRYEIEFQLLEIRTSGGATAYLKVENPASSSSRA